MADLTIKDGDHLANCVRASGVSLTYLLDGLEEILVKPDLKEETRIALTFSHTLVSALAEQEAAGNVTDALLALDSAWVEDDS